jgi:stearoyl-CoA desaturase (delta-9 desaturase)
MAPTRRGLVLRLLVLHALAVPALATGVSRVALAAFVCSYVVRLFGVTAGYHRLLSHHAFKTSRLGVFAFAFLGACSGQRGPLWWAAVHRVHHRTSDTGADPHSPRVHGMAHAHLGWILDRENLATDLREVPDWSRFPELVWLNRYHVIAPLTVAIFCWVTGGVFAYVWPEAGTSSWQCLAWGFVLATLAGMHVTSAVNSLGHRFGARPYPTGDDSGNLWWAALPTLGDGWHNNHHHLPGSVRHGFFWWQLDLTYWALRALAAVGLVWDLREPERSKML